MIEMEGIGSFSMQQPLEASAFLRPPAADLVLIEPITTSDRRPQHSVNDTFLFANRG